jgi:hypothetical protein
MAGLLDYLEGIGETGATLGTGLLSGVVGAPYGLFKGITSGRYGSPEAVRIAEEEAKKFMERNTYVPRGKVAQEALAKAAQLMEASKLPPILPEAAMLGSIPRQAYLAQAERRGMDLERAMEPRVKKMLERGGAGADVLRDLAQGTRSNVYLDTTKTKPNPLVGTRYETQQLPGIVARRPVNYDEMLGGSIMTYPTDMLSRNTLVTNVSDIPLGNNAFVTPGGLMYMMDENNIKNFIGYASNQSAAKAQNTRALQAIEENKKMGGTGRIFMAPHTMPPSGENFSTGPTLGLLSMIKATNPSPSLLDTISDQMRAATVKGKKGKYKDFVGLNDPMAAAQLLTGQGLKAGSAGDLRKVFVDKMSNVAAERGLDFNYPDLQRAMFDPNVMNKPSFWMGDAIYEALPNRGISPGTHGAYGYDMPGIFFGNTRGAPVSQFMQPVYDKILPTQMNKPGSGIGKASVEDMFLAYQHQDEPFNLSGVYADPNQLTRGKLSTAGENISMFMDEEQIKRLKKLLGEE